MLYRVSERSIDQGKFKTVINALEVLLHNIGDVLNLLPRYQSTNVNFTPPSNLDNRDWQFLCINARTIQFQAGEVILHQGDTNSDLWYIQSGCATVVLDDVPIVTLSDGEYFGDISFITGCSARCTVTAKNECIIQRMAADFVLRILECDANLFERFYFMIAKFTAERLVKKTSSWNKVKFLPASPKSSEAVPIEIYFSDGTSQWFECTRNQTIKALRDHISTTIERGKALTDVAYARLYESCVNPISNERQYSVLEDTWPVASIFTRAKYASRHCVYFLLEDPNVTQNEFSLSTAFIINEFPCKSKNLKGTMYIIPKHIVFYGKPLTLSSKKKEKQKNQTFIKLRDYKYINLDASKLSVTDRNGISEKFRFGNSRDSLLAFQTLQSLHPQLQVKVGRKSSFIEEDNHAIVINNFEASSPDEISVSPGQVVNVLHRANDYCKVEDSSKTQKGKVPISHLKFLAWTANSSDTTSHVAEHLSTSVGEKWSFHLPSNREWLKILAGGKLLMYREGEAILRRGSVLQRMYIVVQGACVVQASGDETSILARLGPGDIFGEISLLFGSSTATVVSAPQEAKVDAKPSMLIANASTPQPPESTTVVLVIEADFLQRLFSNDKRLAGKFYKYVAILTQQRLVDRTKYLATESKSD